MIERRREGRAEADSVGSRLRRRALGLAEGSRNRAGALLIDGRSGSGKTSIAAALAAELRLSGRTVVELPVEHLYPGWDGLAEGSAALPGVLDRGEYRRYDWVAGGFAELVRLAGPAADREPPILVVEGCGALSTASLAAARCWSARGENAAPLRAAEQRAERDPGLRIPAVWGVWTECPERERKRRALERDGDVFRPHWERWARQEEALFAETRPRSLAHQVVHTG